MVDKAKKRDDMVPVRTCPARGEWTVAEVRAAMAKMHAANVTGTIYFRVGQGRNPEGPPKP